MEHLYMFSSITTVRGDIPVRQFIVAATNINEADSKFSRYLFEHPDLGSDFSTTDKYQCKILGRVGHDVYTL